VTLFRRIAGPMALVILGVVALAAVLRLRSDEGLRATLGWTAGLTAVSGVLVAFQFADPERDLNEVHGTIIRSDTGQPIEGARVVSRYTRMFGGNEHVSEARTNSRGEFTVQTTRDPAYGYVPLEVTAPGYLKKVATGGDTRGHRTITLIPAPR